MIVSRFIWRDESFRSSSPQISSGLLQETCLIHSSTRRWSQHAPGIAWLVTGLRAECAAQFTDTTIARYEVTWQLRITACQRFGYATVLYGATCAFCDILGCNNPHSFAWRNANEQYIWDTAERLKQNERSFSTQLSIESAGALHLWQQSSLPRQQPQVDGPQPKRTTN